MIPISLWVTLELVKVGQAKFMEWDLEMTQEFANGPEGMKAKTSNLNEELGRVNTCFGFVFSFLDSTYLQ
jgi:magnesium-transporting ATPase (P-type)